MTDVTRDPRTDWCACEPNSVYRCDYRIRILADAIIEHLDPRDGDEAEVVLCINAIEQAAAIVVKLPELVNHWREQQAERLELADGMFTDGNRAYQQGYADAMNACATALEAVIARAGG